MSIVTEKRLAMISAVIPAFNEENTLTEAVRTIAEVLERLSPTLWEIIIVDDGSQDRTLQVARQLVQGQHVRLFSHEHNRGKGAAVRTGVLQTRGDAVLIMDADLSTDPDMLERFIPALLNGANLVTGDRRDPQSRIEHPQSMLRNFMGAVYAAMARMMTGSTLRDFNCGFKLMNGDVARALLARCQSNRWVWDVEIISLAMRQALEVRAIPVVWQQGDRSSVKPFRAAIVSFIELARLWFRLRRNGE